jgi:hypothetical protein
MQNDKKDEKTSTGCREGAGFNIPVSKGNLGKKEHQPGFYQNPLIGIYLNANQVFTRIRCSRFTRITTRFNENPLLGIYLNTYQVFMIIHCLGFT